MLLFGWGIGKKRKKKNQSNGRMKNQTKVDRFHLKKSRHGIAIDISIISRFDQNVSDVIAKIFLYMFAFTSFQGRCFKNNAAIAS